MTHKTLRNLALAAVLIAIAAPALAQNPFYGPPGWPTGPIPSVGLTAPPRYTDANGNAVSEADYEAVRVRESARMAALDAKNADARKPRGDATIDATWMYNGRHIKTA